MKKEIFFALIALILFVPYFCALVIAKTLRTKGHEDMPAIKEWFGIYTEE